MKLQDIQTHETSGHPNKTSAEVMGVRDIPHTAEP